MTLSPTPAYLELCRRNQRHYRLHHAIGILHWDSATMMPPRASGARADALAELESLLREWQTDPALATLLAQADAESLDPLQRANLRESRRVWLRATAVPPALATQRSLVAMRCEHAWREQRHRHDWPGFLENFKPLVELVRREAGCLADALDVGRYDALLDMHEPGLRDSEVSRLLGHVRNWLPGLIGQIRERQRSQPCLIPQGPFALAAQRDLSEAVMRALGFDFQAGRLDVSSHPFCGGTFEDIRLTTRYSEYDPLAGLTATIHETGHALYHMGLPESLREQPVGAPRWGAIHESQALMLEKQLGLSPAFIRWLAPLLRQHLGEQPAFATDNLIHLFQRVEPGFIRVDADEVTYPAHVILRYDIERALIEGEIEAEDIPVRWNAAMRELLGIDPGELYGQGCLQDMHWACGMFGYFPGYLLGAMYAAQWAARIRREQPDLEQQVEAGEFGVVIDWLRQHIHRHASRYDSNELVRIASGEALDPDYLRQHLMARYLDD
ncbi:carboxypeptidase M32 [Chitinimonas lacunae]|uniref:Metal-dependent carboxypeptidase n=1 Tax=Chitinimonas lacunae TaxID=1963018 RepID=A0ABV8MUG2_9NEIS